MKITESKNCRYIGDFDINFIVLYQESSNEYLLCGLTAVTSEYTDYIILGRSKHLHQLQKKYNDMKTNERLISDLYLSKLSIEELQSLKPSIYDAVIDLRIQELQDVAKVKQFTEETIIDPDRIRDIQA